MGPANTSAISPIEPPTDYHVNRSLKTCQVNKNYDDLDDFSWPMSNCGSSPLGNDLEPIFWRLEVQAEDQDKVVDWQQCPMNRNLVLTARRHRNMNATLLQQHLRSATGTTVSTQTVRNLLHGVGMYARRPIICVRLTSRHICDRREWATEHANWRRNKWSNVLVSDESHFSAHPDNRRIFIWRDRGNPYIIRDGPLTARRYRDEILRIIEVPSAASIEDDFILRDDNCRPRRAILVEDFLFEEGIVRMEWPACSPDMNPIEHVWDALGR
ncbi:transposable element Tcb2 transposase [Trichonephila clavipes]|nr:transposable element Tcb2 transposase [Trichonephila clavipes]